MYKKVDASLDFVAREKETLAFWKEHSIFQKSIEQSRGRPAYTFFDGPPTANGKPHIGHILTRCIKDIIPRYKTMKGFDVLRKAGWDTHGLPVELEVERELGLDGKEQIEAYGVEPFVKKCKESVWKYKGEWEQMSDRVGFWLDMDDPYITYENDYIESEWWALKTIHEKGLLYKGHKIVPYCPRCGTTLSSHEVAQGYKDVRETSVIARFPVKGRPGTSILAWTTTPWTLPSNVALCVNAKEEYALCRHGEEKFVLAAALVPQVLGEGAVVEDTFPGSTLVGTEYEPLFPFPVDHQGKQGWRVVSDGYVTLSDGTGIVHIAPAFGEDDARVGRNWDLPFVQLVDEAGRMRGGTPWDGVFVKDADKLILRDLKDSGKLFSKLEFEHSYPFCWRCNTPLIYYARESWFIKMTAVRDKLIRFNRSVNWVPENIKEGRMGNFLENVIDWGISRDRYWGTPLPVWTCGCGHVHVIGSREELRQLGKNVPEDIELHKPFIDRVEVNCPECGGQMRREPAVIDCWFDSGAMPFAQWHYPFENKEAFQRRYPADFISEAVDQTRGWFYTLLAISACLFDEPSFESCLVLGHVQDKDGRKMSKHLGNVVDPWTVLDKQGADAVRWYFYTGSMPWLPSRFYEDAVSESQRKFMGTLWNTYAFYILYADIDGFDPTAHALVPEDLTAMDRWVLSRLNSLVAAVESNLDQLRITEAGRELQRFVDELSNWYVRRSRERFWGSGMDRDKQAAFMTFYTVLETLIRVAAPFVPFLAEQMYQNVVRTVDAAAPESVHLTSFPASDPALIDPALEQNMDAVLRIVTLGRSARNTAAIKNRQPLSRMLVQGPALAGMFLDVVREELNLKEVRFVEDASGYVSYRVKPQLKTLGPRYGKLLPAISAHLAGEGVGDAAVAAHSQGKPYAFTVEGTEVSLAAEDVLVETVHKEGFVTESDQGVKVVLDVSLTPELIQEGMVRELVSKIQTMRKEAGFEVIDHIVVTHEGNERIAAIFAAQGDVIARETLADAIRPGAAGYRKDWDINGEPVRLGVSKV